jgi:hypothetical protein
VQIDFHYYATYCLARAAGLNKKSATTIATCSQFVDDSTKDELEGHPDGGLFRTIATAHHGTDFKNLDRKDQRHIWVPFHFLPGGLGDNFTEKLVCRKDSIIAQEMMIHYFTKGYKNFQLELIGIASHVYADTFAHYGFSGVSSRRNRVDSKTIKLKQSEEVVNAALGKNLTSWLKKYKTLLPNIRQVISDVGENVSGGLGHGAVSTYPDQPFLEWSFEYEFPEHHIIQQTTRNNPETFLEATEALYSYYREIPNRFAEDKTVTKYKDIKKIIQQIINTPGNKIQRAALWNKAAKEGIFGTKEEIPVYKQPIIKQHEYSKLSRSSDISSTIAYRFSQAAIYHKYYILKELLPKHKITVL